LSFENAIRLHKDSILLFKHKSFPTSYQLSILAQEEIGKSSLLEEHIFQMGCRIGEIDSEMDELMAKALKSHRCKQGWFSRVADDYFMPSRRHYYREVESGRLDKKKQNATYVGLTEQGGKLNIKGKIIIPASRVKEKDVTAQITRVNDYIVKLIEECRRGISSVDTDEVDSILTIRLSNELEALWGNKAKDTQTRLAKVRKCEIEEQPN